MEPNGRLYAPQYSSCTGEQNRLIIGPDGQIRYSAVGLLDWGEAQVVKLIAALAPRP